MDDPFAALLSDPVGTNPLVGAALWVEQTMLGTVASAVAILAVASVGVMMLTGRLPLRRGVSVVLGCFVLFGAPTIADGLRALAYDGGDGRDVAPAPTTELPPIVQQPSPRRQDDPYAGASVTLG
ncbi:MAG: TrbC/VirB2 family protein [Rhizorhabdus sp.]